MAWWFSLQSRVAVASQNWIIFQQHVLNCFIPLILGSDYLIFFFCLSRRSSYQVRQPQCYKFLLGFIERLTMQCVSLCTIIMSSWTRAKKLLVMATKEHILGGVKLGKKYQKF